MWLLIFRNACSSDRTSCPEEGLFNRPARTRLTFQLEEMVDFSALMVVEVWEWL